MAELTDGHTWWCNMRPGGNHDGCSCRPAAPSEPPAADSPTPGTGLTRCCMGLERTRGACGDECPADPSPVDSTEPPAETKDDELPLDEGTGRAFEIIDAAELSDWERERRDAVPFLPPAETQQDEERAHCLNCAESGDPDARRVHPAAECPWRPSTFAAEAQQDDASARAVWVAHGGSADDWPLLDEWVRERYQGMAAAALAARPSADTEKLRETLAQLECLAGDECGPLRMVVLDAVESIRAALGDTQ